MLTPIPHPRISSGLFILYMSPIQQPLFDKVPIALGEEAIRKRSLRPRHQSDAGAMTEEGK